jgi:hypothetical protein
MSTENDNKINENDAPIEKIDYTIDIEPKIKPDNSDNNIKIKAEDDSWNYRMKLMLKKIGEKSMGYRWMNEQEYAHYLNVDYYIGIVIIVLTALVTTLTSGTLIGLFSDTNLVKNSDTLMIITLLEVIMSALSGIAIAIRDQGEFKKKSRDYKDTSYKFARIYHSIQEQFSLPIKERENDIQFLKDKIKEYDDLMEAMGTIRPKILQKYINTARAQNHNKPALEEYETIEILDYAPNAPNDGNKEITKIENAKSRIKYEIDRWISNF